MRAAPEPAGSSGLRPTHSARGLEAAGRPAAAGQACASACQGPTCKRRRRLRWELRPARGGVRSTPRRTAPPRAELPPPGGPSSVGRRSPSACGSPAGPDPQPDPAARPRAPTLRRGEAVREANEGSPRLPQRPGSRRKHRATHLALSSSPTRRSRPRRSTVTPGLRDTATPRRAGGDTPSPPAVCACAEGGGRAPRLGLVAKKPGGKFRSTVDRKGKASCYWWGVERGRALRASFIDHWMK